MAFSAESGLVLVTILQWVWRTPKSRLLRKKRELWTGETMQHDCGWMRRGQVWKSGSCSYISLTADGNSAIRGKNNWCGWVRIRKSKNIGDFSSWIRSDSGRSLFQFSPHWKLGLIIIVGRLLSGIYYICSEYIYFVEMCRLTDELGA